MIQKKLQFIVASLTLALAASVVSAASSISNTLTGFTGNSTQGATQAALAGIGLNFTSTGGFEEPTPGNFVDPTVVFDSSGALFGSLQPTDGGRNYLRTTATDFANVSFTAEVTWVTTSIDDQDAYMGFGSGDYGDFRIVDYQGASPAALFFLEVNSADPFVATYRNDSGHLSGRFTAAPGLNTGTNRLRISYDWYRKRMDVAIDLNYAGGIPDPFVADLTAAPVDTLNLYRPGNWPSQLARVFFGGDDGGVFKDLELTVTTAPLKMGDFNNSGTVTGADWTILKTNQHTNLSALTNAQAFAKGDMNGDLANNHTDFTLFKQFYEDANGPGSFAALLAAPEPSSIAVVAAAGLFACPILRRARIRR